MIAILGDTQLHVVTPARKIKKKNTLVNSAISSPNRDNYHINFVYCPSSHKPPKGGSQSIQTGDRKDRFVDFS